MAFKRKDIEQAIVGSKLVFDKAFDELINSDSNDGIESSFDICVTQLFAIKDLCELLDFE